VTATLDAVATRKKGKPLPVQGLILKYCEACPLKRPT
jgi:hypothetical protein